MIETRFINRFKDCINFSKIQNKKTKNDFFEEKYSEEIKSQVLGSGHLIDDSLVKFGDNQRDKYKDSPRPGIVTAPPSQNSDYETEWAPGTTKISNRDPLTIIFYSQIDHNANRDTVFLLNYRRYYKCTTLGKRKFKLPADLLAELETKLFGGY